MFETDWATVLTTATAALGGWIVAARTRGRHRWWAAMLLLVASLAFPPVTIVVLAALWCESARHLKQAGFSLWALVVELAAVAAAGTNADVHPALAPVGAAVAVLVIRGLWFSWDQDRGTDGEPHDLGLLALVVAAGAAASVSPWAGPWAATGAYAAATVVRRRLRDPIAWTTLASFAAWGARVALDLLSTNLPSEIALSRAGHAVAVPWGSPLLLLADAPLSVLGTWAVIVAAVLLLFWARDPSRPWRTGIVALAVAALASGSPSAVFAVAAGTPVLAVATTLGERIRGGSRWTEPRAALSAAALLVWIACWSVPLVSAKSRATRVASLGVPGASAYLLARHAHNPAARESLLRDAWGAAQAKHELRGWTGLDLGDMLHVRGESREALRVWEDAARHAPLRERLVREFALRFVQAESPQLARRQWMRLGAADPAAEAEWTRGVAASYVAAGDWAEVTRWAERSIAAGEHPDSWRLLATAGEKQGRLRDAMAALERVCEEAPDDVDALRRLGELYARCGHEFDSTATWEQVLAMHPGDPRARLALAERSLASGRISDAAAHLAHAEIDASTPPGVAARVIARRQELNLGDAPK